MSCSRLIFLAILLILNSKSIAAKINLALNKSYTISPKPNYELCTDEHDGTQLTDGNFFGSDWTQKSTVGWRIKNKNPIIIVDLGSILSINEVRVHSIGGGKNSVNFPECIAILLSSDGKLFNFVGFIDSYDLVSVDAKKLPHTFVIDKLQAEGRYVKVVMQANGLFLFADEVEVFGQEEGPPYEQKVLPGDLPIIKNDSELFMTIEQILQLKAMTSATLEFANKHMSRLDSDLFRKTQQDLETIVRKLGGQDGFVLSMKQLAAIEGQIGQLRAQIYTKLYAEPYICLPTNPMNSLLDKEMIFYDESATGKIELKLWRGEYESAAVSIINCMQEPLKVSCSIAPLVRSDGNIVAGEDVFTLRKTIFVNGRKVGLIGDALVLLGSEPLTVMPGQITQLWVTVQSSELNSGQYTSSLKMIPLSNESNNSEIKKLPITLDVAAITFPKKTALKSCVCAYPQVSPVTRKVLSEAAHDLQAHYANVLVVHPKSLPFPKKVSDEGKFSVQSDFSELDNLLKLNGYADHYLIWLGFSTKNNDFGLFGQWMTNSWKTAFSFWLNDLVEHLQTKGIGYDRFSIFSFDETLNDNFYEFAKFLKTVNPKVKIYANSFGKGPSEFIRFKDVVDIWCLLDSQCRIHPNWLQDIKAFGKEYWSYETKGPGRANPAYGYYRLLPWSAFKQGLSGAGFWLYADREDHSQWGDAGNPIGEYGVVYDMLHSPADTHGENIIPSRRWEAWREGVEDFEYLHTLQNAINEIKSPGEAAQYQQLLNKCVNEVLSRPDDPAVVYRAREQITTALSQLQNNKSPLVN